MNSIYPINPGDRTPVSGSKKVSQDKTAEKVKAIAVPQMPRREYAASPLQEAQDLVRFIRKEWDHLSVEELAGKLIDLQDRVSLLSKESSSAIEKVHKQAEHLYFQFLFPVAAEVEKERVYSLAKNIHDAAHRTLTAGSLAPFQELSVTQRREVIRYTATGA